jgi:hypothetical protein
MDRESSPQSHPGAFFFAVRPLRGSAAHAIHFAEMTDQQRDSLIRTVSWRNIVANGAEYCALWKTSEGWLLRGSAVAAPDQKTPLLVEYEIHCDLTWRTHRVQVKRTMGTEVRELSLIVEARGVWRLSGDERSDLRDCVDVDLGITPATNTLPIRRLNLAIGQTHEVTAAWIKFPDLTLEPLRQRYTRLGDNSYRYESGTGFSAKIVVDDLGLAIDYAGGWERLAAR